ncbi:MAG: flagellar basal body-associated FliL family protein [Spirochaetaceae bacterium]|jgi:flagellar FliL protein|nr:flagellar basal body-associated FliL family protein [Spirochaetaceae bacterium]
MSDNDDLGLNEEESGEGTTQKKPSKLAALLPTLLKFVAIGLGALIVIVTITVIVFNILNKGGQSQTAIPDSSPYIGTRPQYAWSTIIGPVRATTKDAVPHAVVVDMILGYTLNDAAAQTEIVNRQYELRDFTRRYFSSKSAAELAPENEGRLKQDIIEKLNTQVLDTAKVRNITFNQLSVSEM